MSEEAKFVLVESFADELKEEEAPFWLAMLRIYKELAWQVERGPRRDRVHDAMERARAHWLGWEE